MSLYIKPENQELLWKTIHKTPLIDNYFRALPPGSREAWFQDIVKSFHINNPSIPNQDGLARLNRDTIAYMVTALKGGRSPPPQPVQQHPLQPVQPQLQHPLQQQQQPRQQPQPQPQPQPEYREPTTIYSRSSTNDEFAEKFTNRQKEYESMLQKPLVPEVQFSEKMEDGVIQNMDELIERQLKQRELDIANYSPLPPVGVGPPTNIPHSILNQGSNQGSRKLSIGQDLQGSHIESIPLGASPPAFQGEGFATGKRVTFESDESMIMRFQELEARVRELEAIILRGSRKEEKEEDEIVI